MKIFKHKLYFILMLLMFSMSMYAQVDQTICFNSSTSYSVDSSEGPNGTPGSTYTWSVAEAAFAGTISGNTTNAIDIDWGNTPIGTYTLQVFETKEGCDGEPQEIQIILQSGYEAPTITAIANAFCVGDIEFFNLTGGTPNAQVTYTITSDNAGFTPINATVVLDNNGDATIAIPGLTDANTTEVFTLTLTEVDDETDTDSCSALILDPAVSMSVTVNPIPTTTPIDFD